MLHFESRETWQITRFGCSCLKVNPGRKHQLLIWVLNYAIFRLMEMPICVCNLEDDRTFLSFGSLDMCLLLHVCIVPSSACFMCLLLQINVLSCCPQFGFLLLGSVTPND
jgi:hypothetical protein